MFSKINNITYLKNEPLSKHCTFKVGGNAKYFISAHNIDALLDVLYTCNQHSINHKVIGNGSNLLFDDLGYNGAIIKYDDNFKQFKNGLVQASAGCNISELIQFAQQNTLGGFEFAIGVPAQLGGAITNNLGAYNQEISTYIEKVTILKNNHIVYLSKNDCNFNYHSSALQNSNSIILGATFNLPPQDKNTTIQKANEYFSKRKNSQPLEYPNAGSIFKRTNQIVPAKLIDDTELKGLTIGNAQVSTKHSGFIINLGNAKCKDILNLIKIIKNKIYEKYLINLIEEIEYLSYL
jgi:UDP-N-acetylmuramate dehydrogenase